MKPTRVSSTLSLLALTACFGAEQGESNSSSAALPAPDLVLRELSGPPTVRPYERFEVRAKVCNAGTTWASGMPFQVLLSTDATPSPDDTQIAYPAHPSLAPGECWTDRYETFGGASGFAGRYQLIGVVDPDGALEESDEANNVFAGASMAVGAGPDLIVRTIRAPKSAIGDVELSAEVCNQGTEPCWGATIDIGVEGERGDQLYVSGLDAGACTWLTTVVWSAPGAVRPIASIHGVTPAELAEDNNTTSGEPIGVGTLPDLVVTAISAPPSTTGRVAAEITVCNQGTDSFPGGAAVDLFLSDDAALDTGADFFSGRATLPRLEAARCASVDVDGAAAAGAGGSRSRFLAASVDPTGLAIELIETNNSFVGGPVGIGFGSDLVVRSLRATGPSPRGVLVIETTVCNQGTMWAGSAPELFFYAMDTRISGRAPEWSDFIGSAPAPVYSLAPGECVPRTTRVNPTSLRTMGTEATLVAVVDAEGIEDELDEANNLHSGPVIGVGSAPDLIVTRLETPRAASGVGTVEVTVCNQGGDWAPSSTLAILASADPALELPSLLGEVRAGFGSISSLAAGECATERLDVHSPPEQTPDFGWYFAAIADDTGSVPERLESNNTFVAQHKTSFSVAAPDLVITSLSAPASSSGPFTVAGRVCNQGAAPSGPSWIEVRLEELEVAAIETVALQPGECVVGSAEAAPPLTSGAHRLTGTADGRKSVTELDEDNNTFVGDLIGIGSAPDLAVTAITAPVTSRFGAAPRVSVTACNRGTDWAQPFEVELVQSFDAEIAGDAPIGRIAVDDLAPGQCDTITTDIFPVHAGETFLGAVADGSDVVGELIESNNAFVGPVFGAGSGADLVVRSVRAPASAEGSFTVDLTVCNDGESTINRGDLGLYLSRDRVISPDFHAPFGSDPIAGWTTVEWLEPHRCQDISTQAWASDPGAWVLGVIADPEHRLDEIVESNNAHAGPSIGLGMGPDLVVTALSAPPVVFGDLPLRSTVCNQGTMRSPSSDVLFHGELEPPPAGVPTSSDPFSPNAMIAGRRVRELEPGECDTADTAGFVPALPPGEGSRLRLLATVDPRGGVSELVEDNNRFTGPAIGAGFGPDLVVTALSAPPSTDGSRPVTVSVTVCNQGLTETPSWADLFVYESADPTIIGEYRSGGSGDRRVGFATVEALAAGKCRTVEAEAYLSWPSGTRWLGAIVDEPDTIAEVLEDNNTFGGPMIGVGTSPDFVMTSLRGFARPDGRYEVESTVCNQGQSAGPDGPSLSIYARDYHVGQVWVPMLDPGACATSVSPIVEPPWDGESLLIGVVDEDQRIQELIEENNRFTGGVIGFGLGPDLVIEDLRAPASASGELPLEVRVCNRGNGPASSFDLNVFASTDMTREIVGGTNVPGLMAGQCERVEIRGWAGAGTGEYQLSATVDDLARVGELIESNNTFVGPVLGMGFGPDLLVAGVTGPATASGIFTIAARLCNQGTASANGATFSFYAAEWPIARTSLDLGPGECVNASLEAWAPPGPGEHTIVAIADELDDVDELRENNNTTTGGTIGFGWGPDLAVLELRAPASANGPFALEATVCNQGNAWASPASLTFYASRDRVIVGMADHPVGADYLLSIPPIPGLEAGECARVAIDALPPPAEGEYVIGAIADEDQNVSELVESNNTFAGPSIGFGFGPDLVIRAVQAPPSASDSLLLVATVCNEGTGPSAGTDLGFYASRDGEITGDAGDPFNEDHLLGSTWTAPLDPGACATSTTQGSVPASATGEMILGAIVDEQASIAELQEGNNTYAGRTIGIGYGPDLVVSAISAPPTAVDGFMVQTTVCNQGTAASGSTMLDLFLSTDQEIVTSRGGDRIHADQMIASRWVPDLQAGECSSEDVTAHAWGVAGELWIGAIVDDMGGVSELIESNNVAIGGLIGVGPEPDLVVASLGAGPYARPGGSFAVRARVCNQGASPASPSDLGIYASIDETIAGGPAGALGRDLLLGYVWTDALEAGACADVAGTVFAPAAEGLFWLGAIADENGAVREVAERNNGFAGPRFEVRSIFCGDGAVNQPSEQCDDENFESGDGCTATCRREVCGDGVVNNRDEQCDDSNAAGGDGCSATCQVEYCGDRVVNNNGTETCDDGNNLDGDGCTARCGLEYCGDGLLNNAGTERCDDGNANDGDGCDGDCKVEGPVHPWADNANGTLRTGIAYHYAMGYHFTPEVDGVVTELGGQFNGTKTVRLFNKATGALLAETQVTAANAFAYAAITPVAVSAGTTYTVAVYLAGSGGTYRSAIAAFPRSYSNVRIDASTYAYTASNPTARPTNSVTTVMYGQADIRFTPVSAPWQSRATGTPTLNIGWNYAMGYHFTPQHDGWITALGGQFSGTKRVRLYEKATGRLLAETQVAGNNGWTYGAITPVAVRSGTAYTVAVYLAGSGGAYRATASLPLVHRLLRIDGTTYVSTASNPNAIPTLTLTSRMYGQADVKFAPAP